MLAADQRFELVLSRSDTEDGLRAAASGRAPANVLGFQQRDAVAAFGQVQCSRKAGDATTYHAHVAAGRTLKLRLHG